MWRFDGSVIWFITKSAIFIWLAIVMIYLLFHIFEKSKKSTLFLLLGFGVLLLFCFFVFQVVMFAGTLTVSILVILPSIFICVLLTYIKRFVLRSKRYRSFYPGVLYYIVGCAMSFLFTLVVLDVAAGLKFKSNIDVLSQSQSLVLRTAIPRRGFSALPWEKKINDLRTIKRLSSLLASSRYKLTYMSGLLSTTDWIEVNMFRDEKKQGMFVVMSGDLDLGFISIKYITDEPSRTLHELLFADATDD